MSIPQLNQHLTDTGARWVAKDNPITQLPPEDRSHRLGILEDPVKLASLRAMRRPTIGSILHAGDTLPNYWDWRDKNVISNPLDQKNCGSCVAFSTVGVLSAQVAIENNGVNIPFSVQDLFFCSPHGLGCDGWWPSEAITYIQTSGVVDFVTMPYSLPGSCPIVPNRADRIAKCTTNTQVSDIKSIQAYLSTIGPLVFIFYVYDDFYSYGGGIYHHVTGTLQGGHAIMCVGYDNQNQCWICRNSWGASWGEGGYFRIAYNDSSGIDSFPAFGISKITLAPGLISQYKNQVTMQYSSLGGICTATPSLVCNGNRQDAIVKGSDTNFWWRWTSAPSQPWAQWLRIGNNTQQGTGAPCATWVNGTTLMVAAQFTDGIYTIAYNAAQGWQTWKKVDSDTTAIGINITADSSGHAWLCKVGSDKALYIGQLQ